MSHSVIRRFSVCAFSTFGFALLAFAASCTTGQIGGEIEHKDGPGEGGDHSAGGCEERTASEIALDEETSLGITAQDVIDAISGTHETTLSWAEDITNSDIAVSPDAGESTITIEVIPREESATFVDLEPKESDNGQEDLLIEEGYGACTDEIRVVADVVVTSENGALDDSFEVTFRAKSASVVSGSVEVSPGELEGSFDVTVEGNGEPVGTRLSLSFAYGTVSGELSGHIQEVHGDPDDDDSAVSQSAEIVYGRFPASGCDSGVPIDEDSPWSDAILDAVNSNTEFDFAWQSGETTALTVSPTVGPLCLEVNEYEGGGTIFGEVSALVSSDDGRIDAAWDLQIRAATDGEEITSIDVRYLEKEQYGYPAEDFAAETGISGIETDAAELGFEFVYSIGLDGGTTGGTLTVVELLIPECVRPDYEPDVTTPDGDSGGGSDGCSGIDYAEIETATFSAADNQSGE